MDDHGSSQTVIVPALMYADTIPSTITVIVAVIATADNQGKKCNLKSKLLDTNLPM